MTVLGRLIGSSHPVIDFLSTGGCVYPNRSAQFSLQICCSPRWLPQVFTRPSTRGDVLSVRVKVQDLLGPSGVLSNMPQRRLGAQSYSLLGVKHSTIHLPALLGKMVVHHTTL